MPDFRALHSGNYSQESLCVWCFDLMELNGEDLRPLPLIARKQKLELLLRRHDHPYVRYSEAFKNAEQLLAECRVRGLEGIVSKKKQAPYKSGKCDWIKVKCAQWKGENRIGASCLPADFVLSLMLTPTSPPSSFLPACVGGPWAKTTAADDARSGHNQPARFL